MASILPAGIGSLVVVRCRRRIRRLAVLLKSLHIPFTGVAPVVINLFCEIYALCVTGLFQIGSVWFCLKKSNA